MGRIVIVQEIKTVWSKASRGGKAAVQRNSVPEVARVPLHRIQEKDITVIHHKPCAWRIGSSDGEIIINPEMKPLTIGCVTIEHSDETVCANFTYNQGCGGAPDRGWARKTLTLAINEWGQIVYNGRFSGYDDCWWYEKMVVNVGMFDPASNSVFTRNKPNQRFTALGHLF